jgi:Asp/Glu/hydantoin racemase
MRLLFINPNTSAHLTELGARVARSAARPETEIVPTTGRFGAHYITSRAAAAIAGHAVLDSYAQDGHGVDAVIIACFGDPGLFALRELAPVPVVGMAEAACHLASTLGRKFSIVTGGHRWGPMLEEFVAAIGLATNLASVRTLDALGADIAAKPEAALENLVAACREATRQDGAEVVVLGGLGLAGLAERIGAGVPVPIVDNVVAAVKLAEAAATLAIAHAKSGPLAAATPVKTTGLSAALAALLEGRDGPWSIRPQATDRARDGARGRAPGRRQSAARGRASARSGQDP